MLLKKRASQEPYHLLARRNPAQGRSSRAYLRERGCIRHMNPPGCGVRATKNERVPGGMLPTVAVKLAGTVTRRPGCRAAASPDGAEAAG